MKRIYLLLAAICLCCASCNSDIEIVDPWAGWDSPEFVGDMADDDMAAFLEDATHGVCFVDTSTMRYTNGEEVRGDLINGGRLFWPMMLDADGTCYLLKTDSSNLDNPPAGHKMEWRVSDTSKNAIELYEPDFEESDFPATVRIPRTTIKILSYKDGRYLLRGLQPLCYETSSELYPDYCTVEGYIDTNPETVAHYRELINAD